MVRLHIEIVKSKINSLSSHVKITHSLMPMPACTSLAFELLYVQQGFVT